MTVLWLVGIGLAAGFAGGALGIGGATLMVPMLVIFLGMKQHLAQGTSLAAMLLPVGLLAVWAYYQHGNVDIKSAAWIAAGFVFGGLLGAVVVQDLSPTLLRRIFGVFLSLIAVRMIFSK
jgi:hypothetical protein